MSDRPISDRPHRWSWPYALAVLAVVVLQLALIGTHDYFVDEWQALQIAVQSPDLSALFANLRYEGHPPLWYLLLRAVSAVVGPAHALMAASVLCALTTLTVVALRSPWPRWVRLAVILAEPILFEYGTVSRGASLGVALTFAALALWCHPRGVWVVLAALPLVDFLFGVIALALIALRWSERLSWWRPGVAFFMVASLLAAWSVIPAPDFLSVYRPSSPTESLIRWVQEMAVVMLPIQWSSGPQWDAVWLTPLTPVLGVGFLILTWHQTRGRPVERAVAIGVPLVMLGFMVAVHILAIRHVLLAAIVFLAVLWRQGEAGVAIRRPTSAWLIASALCGLATAGFALTRPFDTAPAAAHEIERLGLEGETWLSFPAQHAQGVSALTGIGFEGVELGCRQDFIRWNFRHRLTEPELLGDWLTREAARSGTFYLLTQHRPAATAAARPVATIAAGLDGKIYHIYRIAGATPGRRALAPPCVPGNRRLPPLAD